MTNSLFFQLFTVMAGLDPAIHGAAWKVKLRVFWYNINTLAVVPGLDPGIHPAARTVGISGRV
jgi:hypothetical protein